MKKRRRAVVFLALAACLSACSFLPGTAQSAKKTARQAEAAWKDGDAAEFCSLFADPASAAPEESVEEPAETESAGDSVRFLSEEEFQAAVGEKAETSAAAQEETEDEEGGAGIFDLSGLAPGRTLKTLLSGIRGEKPEKSAEPDENTVQEQGLLGAMMQYGTCEMISAKEDQVTFRVNVPDLTVLAEELAQSDAERADLTDALLARMSEDPSGLVMRECEVTVSKTTADGETCLVLTEAFLDAVYGGLLSGYREAAAAYYQSLGGALR